MKVIKFAPGLIPVFKHQQHDQSTHGSWADSGSPKLTILGKNDGVNQFFNESTRVVRYQPESKEPEDYVLYANKDFVVALVKPTDGTTINGYSDGGTNKGEIGHLDITGAGSNPWRSSAKDDNKATIVEVAVRQAHQRRGLASAMLRFHRDMFPELDVQHSDSQLPEGKAWADVVKHQEHDQSTHGSWATGQKGGSGLSHREMFNLKRNRQDPLVKKVYEAEEKNHNQIQNKNIEQPSAPARSQFEEYSDYNDAYKKYSKDFLNWSKEVTTAVISPMGKKHLDGTPAGVNGYVRDVLRQDWFVEQFGKGGSAGNPEVKVTSNLGAAGSYRIGFKGDQPVSVLSVDRGYSRAEPNLVHEIAHYATTISATSPHDGHGVEFVRNHIFIAGKVIGDSFANQLKNSYREAGIPLGD